MLQHIIFFCSGAQGEERCRCADGTVGLPTGAPTRHPSHAPHRGHSRPHSANSALTRACGVRACSPAAFPCLFLPSSLYLRVAWPFHFFAPPCAQALATAPCTWSWLDIGAARRMIGQNIVQLDWADGLGLEGVCSVRVCGLVAAQTGILGPERQRANLHVCPSFSVFFCWLMCGPVSTIVS